MTYDFLIIGGGIAGVSAAARLSHLGRVLLLEAEDHLAHHASGRSAALFEPRYGLAPVVALSYASEDHLVSADGGVLSPRGMMMVAGPDQRALFDREQAHFHLDEISAAEARAIVPILNPDTVGFAGVSDDARDIDTDLLIQNFLREARANGAEVLTRARVGHILRHTTGWTAGTAQGDFTGRILVNAAGAWVDRIAAMAGIAPLGFTPYRRSMARIPAPGGHDLSRWPTIFGAATGWRGTGWRSPASTRCRPASRRGSCGGCRTWGWTCMCG